jgi:hypothetical protein
VGEAAGSATIRLTSPYGFYIGVNVRYIDSGAQIHYTTVTNIGGTGGATITVSPVVITGISAGGSVATAGRHQQMSFSNSVIQYSIGYPRDTGQGLDNYMMAIGPAVSADLSFTTAQSIITFLTAGGSSDNAVGIAGVNPFQLARLAIGAGSANYAQMNFANTGTLKTVPVAGDLWYDGTNFYVRSNGATSTLPGTVVLTGTSGCTFVATNKPGATAGATTPTTWLKYITGGATYWVPAYAD